MNCTQYTSLHIQKFVHRIIESRDFISAGIVKNKIPVANLQALLPCRMSLDFQSLRKTPEKYEVLQVEGRGSEAAPHSLKKIYNIKRPRMKEVRIPIIVESLKNGTMGAVGKKKEGKA